MRILFVTQWFDPEPNFKGLLFAEELMRRGHQVEVLTGFPNYPSGKLYEGYTLQWRQREMMNGVSVLRVPLYPSHDRSSLRRIFNYTSFALSAATLGAAAVRWADVAYVYHPPATVGLPALALKWLRRIPFVYDIQDLWPDTLSASGMLNSPAVLSMIGHACRFLYRQADGIAVLSPGFRERLIQRGVSASKIEVIYNWSDERQLQREEPDEHLARTLGLAGRFNLLFAGTMGRAQALDAVLDAARMVAEQTPKIQFCFVGGGIDVERLKEKAAHMGLTNVLFLPRRPMSEIGKLLALADALLVHLADDPLFAITIPSKTQAYMAVGKPILMAVQGDAASLVKRAEAGLTCQSENAEQITHAVLQMAAMPGEQLQQMGQNGRRFYEQELSFRAGVDRFEALFRAVARR